MRDGYRRGALPRPATPHQMDVLAAYVAFGTLSAAADLMGIQPSTAKRHLADLRTKSGPLDRAAHLQHKVAPIARQLVLHRTAGRLPVAAIEVHRP